MLFFPPLRAQNLLVCSLFFLLFSFCFCSQHIIFHLCQFKNMCYFYITYFSKTFDFNTRKKIFCPKRTIKMNVAKNKIKTTTSSCEFGKVSKLIELKWILRSGKTAEKQEISRFFVCKIREKKREKRRRRRVN